MRPHRVPTLNGASRRTLEAGGPGQCLARLEDRFLGETAVQGLLHRIGELFGRSATLWRWGGGVPDDIVRCAGGPALQLSEDRMAGAQPGKLRRRADHHFARARVPQQRWIFSSISGTRSLPCPGSRGSPPRTGWQFEELSSPSLPAARALPPLDAPRPGPNEATSSGLQNSVGTRTPRTVGISYAGEPEANKQAIRQITARLLQLSSDPHRERAYEVIEYKANHGIGHTHEVIRELTKGDLVLIFLSENYYDSPYCMAEFVLTCKHDSGALFLRPHSWVFGFAGAQNLRDEWVQGWLKRLERPQKRANGNRRKAIPSPLPASTSCMQTVRGTTTSTRGRPNCLSCANLSNRSTSCRPS